MWNVILESIDLIEWAADVGESLLRVAPKKLHVTSPRRVRVVGQAPPMLDLAELSSYFQTEGKGGRAKVFY